LPDAKNGMIELISASGNGADEKVKSLDSNEDIPL
jgi:hypothetical protein